MRMRLQQSKPSQSNAQVRLNRNTQAITQSDFVGYPLMSMQQSGDYQAGECRLAQNQIPASNKTTPIDVSKSVNEALHSNGQALDPSTRTLMESRFGHDFSQVRVHSDAKAAASARAVNASAYTVGQDIIFGTNQYRPSRSTGRKLLAHELVHVVQQRCTPTDPTGNVALVSRDSPLEHEARRVANSLTLDNASVPGQKDIPAQVVVPKWSVPQLRVGLSQRVSTANSRSTKG